MKKKIIVIDTETTGLDWERDEILQLSIIDGDGSVLFNKYFKPTKKKSWKEAMRINGITPQMVINEKSFSFYKKEIQNIFDNADIIIGYNTSFDMNFILEKGIKINEQEIVDVMDMFAPIYGKWNEVRGEYKWQKLVVCAQYYDFNWEEEAHNSLGDVKATLYCYYKILEGGEV